MTAFPWLDRVYVLVSSGADPDEIIDLVFHEVDGLCSEDRFDECNTLLNTIDLERLDTQTALAFLSITLAAGPKLPDRSEFYTRCARRIEHTDPDRSKRLLAGLRDVWDFVGERSRLR